MLITFLVFPIIPNIIQELYRHINFDNDNYSVTYMMIFEWGVITMLAIGAVLMGRNTKNEFILIIFSELFLVLIFHQNYNENYLILSLSFLTVSFVILFLRIPLRMLITHNKILIS
jgi:hypothetical protein